MSKNAVDISTVDKKYSLNNLKEFISIFPQDYISPKKDVKLFSSNKELWDIARIL